MSAPLDRWDIEWRRLTQREPPAHRTVLWWEMTWDEFAAYVDERGLVSPADEVLALRDRHPESLTPYEALEWEIRDPSVDPWAVDPGKRLP